MRIEDMLHQLQLMQYDGNKWTSETKSFEVFKI